ncbi:MAG: choice-of-anchor D domain-containing protein [Bacteroidetes bacterium]|nr:choice-of-anchor D domain-containing protein [Bacteroidota bacterium]
MRNGNIISGANDATYNASLAGDYSVVVTNSGGCSITSSPDYTVSLKPLPILVCSSLPVIPPSVNNGSVSVAASGGNGSFTYLWSPGGQTTATVNGLGVGTYTVTVTSDGCESTCTTIVRELNYTITTTGNVITITDLSTNSDVLNVTQDVSNIRFAVTPNTRWYSINGGTAIQFTTLPSLSLVGISEIVVNAQGGNDQNIVGAFTINLPKLTINGGTGNDVITFLGDINFASNRSLDIDLQNDAINPGEDYVVMNTNTNLNLFGTGSATIKASKNIVFNSGSSIISQNGNIIIEGNQQAIPTVGSAAFSGITTSGSIIECTGTGNIELKGKGGANAATTYNDGIQLQNTSRVETNTGNIVIDGQGGQTPNNSATGNYGLFFQTNVSILTGGGNISLSGTGGGAGTSINNYGIGAGSTYTISATGNGNITLNGTGGGAASGSNNLGVWLNPGSITTVNGSITITGVEGLGAFGYGISIPDATQISTLPNGGDISLISNSQLISGTCNINTNSSKSVTLRPYTNNTAINLGSTSNTIGGPLSLSDAELDRVSCGTLKIGNSNSGAITVSSIIARPVSTHVELHSSGDILISGGEITTLGGNLLLNGGNAPAAVKPTYSGSDALLTSGTLSFGTDLAIVINGLTANTQYTQLLFTGNINLTGVNLVLSGTYVVDPCAALPSFIIVSNPSSGTTTGTFVGLPEGAIISNFLGSSHNAKITYVGGSGNDIVITVIKPEIELQGNSITIADGDATPDLNDHTDFGNVPVSLVRTYTIQNTGNDALTVSSINVTGGDAAMFTVGSLTPASPIPLGNSATFTITFVPTSLGLKTTTLQIANNDCNEAVYNFTIQGTGSCIAPTITCPANQLANTTSTTCDAVVTYSSSPIVSGTPTPTLSYSFSGATTGSGSGDGSGSTFNKGTTTVTLTATNACGNPSCSFDVVVSDITAPSIACSGPVTINNTPGLCSGTTILTPPTASDNCTSSGNAIDLDGVNDYISTNYVLSGSYTKELWIYVRDITNNANNFITSGGSTISTPNYYGGFLGAGNGSPWNTVSDNVPIALNTWIHVAVSYDATSQEMNLYKNGNLVSTASSVPPPPADIVQIGAWYGVYFTNGKLDEVRVWNVARTQAEIQANMNIELNAQPGLMLSYHFDQGIPNGTNTGINLR